MKKITILIPTYNEEEVLPTLMEALKQTTSSLSSYHFEFRILGTAVPPL